jgi:PPOX class probable F420-dependent enzyme
VRITTALARDRFGAARVAQLGTVNSAGDPHLVPVTFAVVDAAVIDAAVIGAAVIGAAVIEAAGPDAPDDPPTGPQDLVVFAVDHKPKTTAALRRLENIQAHPRVAFLVDGYEEDWERLWWVRADATAGILEGTVRRRGIAALRAKYPQYQSVPPDGVVVGAAVSRWTGWQASAIDLNRDITTVSPATGTPVRPLTPS